MKKTLPEKLKIDPMSTLFLRLLGGILFLIIIYLLDSYTTDIRTIGLYLIGLTIGSLLLDIFEHRYRILPSFLSHIGEHKIRFSRRSLFLVAALIVFAYFQTQIALAALSITLVGTIIGSVMRQNAMQQMLLSNTMQGFIVSFIINTASAYLFINEFFIALPMAAVASFVESYASGYEDELIIPLLASGVGQVILTIL